MIPNIKTESPAIALRDFERDCELMLASYKNQLKTNNYEQKKKAELGLKVINSKLVQIEQCRSFKPGCWVRNGKPVPGKVIGYKIKNNQALVEVQWSNKSEPDQLPPVNLELVEPEDLESIWSPFGRYPKLIRRIDQIECSDRQIIEQKLAEAKTTKQALIRQSAKHQLVEEQIQKIQYCQNRLNKLFNLNFAKTEIKYIPIAEICRDRQFQQRVSMCPATVLEYKEAIENGAELPAIKVKFDGKKYYLFDGFHTTEANWSLGKLKIKAEVSSGTREDAILASCAVNSGLRRTNADKRKAVETVLNHPNCQDWSDRQIARHCQVDHKTVAAVRRLITEPSPKEKKLSGEFPTKNQPIIEEKKSNPESDRQIYDTSDRKSFNTVEGKPTEQLAFNLHATPKETYQVGDLVWIDTDSARPDKRLIGHKNGKALITAAYENSVDLRIWSNEIKSVSIHDIKKANSRVGTYVLLEPHQLAWLMENYGSLEEFFADTFSYVTPRQDQEAKAA